MSRRNLELSRCKPKIAELCNLESDIGEEQDLAEQHPEIVSGMTTDFKHLIEQGSGRAGQKAANDLQVRFDITQKQRWAPALNDWSICVVKTMSHLERHRWQFDCLG